MDFTGYVADVVEPGEEYALFLGRGCSQMWVNAPDDITNVLDSSSGHLQQKI